MSASGNPPDGPKACPFVALELDRDRRAERPDYRHRCFAEPTPATRSIAHQEAYCLSPNFPSCPVFQDWALRAAARPVGAPAPAAATGAAAVAGLAAVGGVAGADEPSIEAELPPIDQQRPTLAPLDPLAALATAAGASAADASSEPDPGPLAATAAASQFDADSDPSHAPNTWDEPAETQQLGAFDEPAAQTSLPGALTAPESEPHSSWGEPDAGYQEPPDLEPPAGYVPPPARRDDPTPHVEDAAVPAFLAGRAAAQPASTALPPPRPSDHVTAEELVPSWEIDGRYGAEAAEDGGGGNRIDSILTAIAVIAILALGVAGVLFLPGLLAGGPGPSRTPPPSILAPSTLPSSGPSSAPSTAPQTTQPTSAPATANANPGASPRFHRIRVGDTLAKIARRFGITVEELLAANPEITDPNRIFVGQVIIIPQP